MQFEKNEYSLNFFTMKKIYTLFAAMVLVSFSYAQLPDGSIAPNFSLYEINKTSGEMMTDHTINLYDILNDYKVVYIDVSATTCGPCYYFHVGGTLESIYENYGPNTPVNDSRVLFIEGANTGNSWNAIIGNVSSSVYDYWDCTHVYEVNAQGQASVTNTLVSYPVIPLRIEPNYPTNYSSFHNGWDIGYFPTVYMVCSNRMVYNMPHPSYDASELFHNLAMQWNPEINNTNDAFIGYKTPSSPVQYCDYNFTPSITLQNVGTANITSATLHVVIDGTDVQTVNWTGNLAQFATTQVPLVPITGNVNGNHSFSVEIVDVNGVPDEGNLRNTYSESFWLVSDIIGSSCTQDFSSDSIAPWCIADYTGGGILPGSEGLFVHNGALRFNAYNISSGDKCEFVAPMMDFTDVSYPIITFDYAHKRYGSYSERLKVMASSDCGATWKTLWSKSGSSLATAGSSTSNYTNPSSSDFQQARVGLEQFAGQSNVLIKFEFTSGYGNNVYIDNINVTYSPTAVESVDESELSIFPNPVKDVLNINYDKAISQIDVFDVNGKLVKTFTTVNGTINVSDLSDGVYMLNIQTEEGMMVKKIVKE